MLGGLGSRLRMIFSLGIIKEETYKELSILTKVRNEFAHFPDVESFAHPRVQGLVSSILALRNIRALKPYYDYAYPLKASITLSIGRANNQERGVRRLYKDRNVCMGRDNCRHGQQRVRR